MESARVRYLRTSCWRIRKQRVCKYRTKYFPCCNLFILYLLRFFNPNQTFSPFIRQNKYQVMFSFRSRASASSNPSVNVFRNVYFALPTFDLFPFALLFYVVCFKLSDISLLGKTRCRRKRLMAYLPFLKLFLPLPSVEKFAKQANLASHRVFVRVFLLCSSWIYFLIGLSKAINLF